MAAKRYCHSTGFYVNLNELTLADFYENKSKNKGRKTMENGRLYNVQRVIACRESKDSSKGKEYLIHWTNYSSFEATWEPARHLNQECITYFENPTPEKNVIMNEVCRLRVAVSHALKASRTRQTITVEFRQDVFKYLFSGKGYQEGLWLILEKDDFSEEYFNQPSQWDSILDLHLQGIKIHYPVKLRHFVSWSPKGFLNNQQQTVEAPRAYQEKLSMKLIKVAA